MRVAFVTTSYPESAGDPSGHFVRAEARAHLASGDEVSVIAPAEHAAHVGLRDDEGLTVHALDGGGAFGWPGVAARLGRSPLAPLAAARWVYSARARLASLDAQLVVAHWVLPSVWPIASARPRAEVVGVSHGADVRLLLAMPAPLRSRAVSRLCASMSRWRFVSETLLESLVRGLAPRDECAVASIAEVLASPLDMPAIDAEVARARRRQMPADKVFSVVGRLTPGKRVHRALDYVRGRPGRTHVVVVGDGPERASLERYAEARGVSATFVGKTTRAEAALWMAASDELVIASAAEGLSTVAREAAVLGVPVRFVS